MTGKPSNAEYKRAADSRTAPEELTRLATAHPVLRPTIAANPNAYPALRDWIARYKALPVEDVPDAPPATTPGVLEGIRAVARPLAIVGAAMLVLSGLTVAWSAGVQAIEQAQFDEDDASDGGVDDSVDGTSDDGTTTDDGASTGDGTAAAEPDASDRLPTSCDQLFSTGMRSKIERAGFALQTNPAGFPTVPLNAPLASRIQKYPHIDCWWAPVNGGSHGILTTIAQVTDAEALDVEHRLSAHYSPLAELGGIRYFYEKKKSGGSPAYGESHIVLDHLWFATRWIAYGPKGYTGDMVKTYLG